MTIRVLIVYDTNGGNTAALAERIASGVDRIDPCEAVLRRVPKVTARTAPPIDPVPATGAPYVTLDDLRDCAGLIIGSPTHFGNMSASLKHFLDQTTAHWMSGTLTGKPAAAFTSTGSLHGGQETTLITMMMPLLHHGMFICGLPYANPELSRTTAGGTPYGPSHVSGEDGQRRLDDNEATLAVALGARVATLARQLQAPLRHTPA